MCLSQKDCLAFDRGYTVLNLSFPKQSLKHSCNHYLCLNQIYLNNLLIINIAKINPKN